MAYTANIPQSGDSPSQSQPLILANFQEIATAFNLNHGSFGTAGVGKHEFLQMPQQGAAPATIANEGALYTKDVSGSTELFWREESNGTEYQVTNQAVKSTNGSMLFPGGLLVQWGNQLMNGTTNVTFPIPYSSSVFSVVATPALAQAFRITNITTTGFQFGWSGAASANASWISIGV